MNAPWPTDFRVDGPPPLVLKVGERLIQFVDVDDLDLSDLENEHVRITRKDGKVFDAYGFDAIEAVMALKPSALEGRRLKWQKGAWAFHNMIGHPWMQILAWLGFTRRAIKFHDDTTPRPR
jgi:hypothetical protein